MQDLGSSDKGRGPAMASRPCVLTRSEGMQSVGSPAERLVLTAQRLRSVARSAVPQSRG